MTARLKIELKPKYNYWTVLKYSHNHQNHSFYLCKCECGTEKLVSGNYLRAGKSKSCGCHAWDYAHKKKEEFEKKYPNWKKFKSIYHGMKLRCESKISISYKNYGGRGIKICKQWQDFKKFYKWASKTYIPNMQLDRISNDGNYTPKNCRWVTQKENMQNTRMNRKILYEHKIFTVSQLSEKLNISYGVIKNRLRLSKEYSISIEKALSYPPKSKLKCLLKLEEK